MQNARALLEQLLSKGKLEAAIEASLILCRHYGDQERSSIATHHSGRFHSLMNDYNAGTLSDDDYRPERAKINRAMLDWVHNLPTEWTQEALTLAGFSASAFDQTSPRHQKSFLEKWGLIIGIVAGLMAIAGVTLKDVFFPKKELPAVTQPVQPKPETTTAQPTATQTTQTTQESLQKEPQAVPKPSSPKKTEPKPEEKAPTQVKTPSKTLATPDNKFRSFGKSKIVDDMERGYMGQKFAFRNVRTLEILCCYADAEDFSGGKAYVSKDGQTYLYIDKKGSVVK